VPSTAEIVEPMFVLQGGKEEITPTVIYLVEINRNMVYTYGAGTKIKVDLQMPYSLCVVEGPNVYVISKDDFAKAVASKTNNFFLTKLGAEITDIFELKKAIGII
jgi:hypothetical protein